jgi:hypothetical protein
MEAGGIQRGIRWPADWNRRCGCVEKLEMQRTDG